MVHKKFSKSLYDKYNQIGKDAVRRFFTNGYTVTDNPDRFGADLMLCAGNQLICYIEVEVKVNWKGDTFPYQTVQIPERKKKYYTKGKCLHFQLNESCTKGLIITGDAILDSPLKEVPNKYVPKGEYFFRVPIDKAKFVDMT